MKDCRGCGCDCAGCVDRRRFLTTGDDKGIRSIWCRCGAWHLTHEQVRETTHAAREAANEEVTNGI